MHNLSLRSKFIKKIEPYLGSKLKQAIKQSLLYKIYKRSSGNWKYPFFAFKWEIANFLSKPKKVSVDGIILTIPCQNWITHFRWYLFKTKEIEVRDFIKNFMNDGEVFFDIGANIGVFSVFAAKYHQNSNIYCFEAEYSNLDLLKKNIFANGVNKRVKIFSVGISDKVGFSNLNLSNIEPGSAVHTENLDHISKTDEGYEVVWKEGIMTSTLDYFCEVNKIVPDCIKLDTDGNELKILRGAFKTLKNFKLKNIIIEMPLHDIEQTKNCEKILKESGFQLYWSERDKNNRNEIWTK